MDCVLVNAQDDMGYVWSFTLRGNDLDELFEKMGACGLKFSKQGFVPSGRPSYGVAPSVAAKEVKMCKKHNVPMEEKVSKKSGKPYWSHYSQEEGICFGSGYQGIGKSY